MPTAAHAICSILLSSRDKGRAQDTELHPRRSNGLIWSVASALGRYEAVSSMNERQAESGPRNRDGRRWCSTSPYRPATVDCRRFGSRVYGGWENSCCALGAYTTLPVRSHSEVHWDATTSSHWNGVSSTSCGQGRQGHAVEFGGAVISNMAIGTVLRNVGCEKGTSSEMLGDVNFSDQT